MTNNQSRVYKFSNFNGGKVVRENIFNKDYLVVGDENIIVAFETNTSTNNLTFTYDFDNSEKENKMYWFVKILKVLRKETTLKTICRN